MGLNLCRLEPFGATLYFVLDSLTFSQSTKTVCSDAAEVDENVLTTILGSNETKTFRLVKPLNITDIHVKNSFRNK